MLGAGFLWTAHLLDAKQAATSPPQNPPAPTLTVQVQLVNLPVVVRNKNGALVTTLSKEDFSLAVDGRQQPIRYFDLDNNLPLTLGLLVDISGSVRSALDDERTASETFFDQMVTSPAGRPPDQAFLLQFAHQVDLLQDRTPSVPKLRTALQKVGDEPRDDSKDRGNSGRGEYGRGRGFRGAGTTLYDAIYLGSADLMQKQQGRKAFIVLTDGEDRGSMESLNSAIAAAERAETVVYAIYFQGEQMDMEDLGTADLEAEAGFRVEAVVAVSSRSMAAKFSGRSAKKPEVACSRSPASRLSPQSIPRSVKNCALSTASATAPMQTPRPRAFTASN